MIKRALNVIKRYNSVMLYISLIFVVSYLLSQDKLQPIKPTSYTNLISSFIFLLFAFLMHSLQWGELCRNYGIRVKPTDALASNGLYIFTKYMPGKIWILMGKASYISNKYDVPLTKTTFISAYNQLYGVIIGSFFGLVYYCIWNDIKLYIVLIYVVIILLVFSGFTSSLFARAISLIFSSINPINLIRPSIRYLFYLISYWLFLCIGFSFLLQSFIAPTIDLLFVGFSYPVAVILGIAAIFSPGGLGIREGVIAYILMKHGISTTESVSIGVVARLWFLIGELGAFIIGVASNRVNRN